MMKKILALSIIACFLFQNTIVFAQEYSANAIILARNELMQVKKGRGYITQLEKALPQMSDIQLESLGQRIDTLSGNSQAVSRTQTALITYIDLAVQQEILTRSGEISQADIQALKNTQTLSPSQKQNIEAEIIAAQKLLQKNLETATLSLEKTWETMSSYEENGTMTMDFDMNLEDLGSIDSGMSLKNYSAKQKDFNQQLSGQFEAFLNASFGGQDVKASGKSLIDFISTDGNMYFLAKNLETKLEPIELEKNIGSNDIIAKLKELANSNTYIKISDPEAAQGIELLRNISPENALTQSSKLLQTVLFTPIAQKGESYVLIPTKHMCDSMKEFSGVFDPLAGKTCSESQYKNMLSDMQDAGIEILYTPGVNKKIEMILNNSDARGNMSILWNEKELLSITGKIADSENPGVNFMTLSFLPQESLEIKFKAEESVDISLTARLNATSIESLDMTGTIEDTLRMKLHYKNGYLDSSLTYDDVSAMASCTLFGALTNTKSQLEGKCNFESDDLKYSFGSSQVEILYALSTDTSDQKNNVAFSLRGISNKKEFMKFTLSNTAIRNTNSNFTITAPKKSVDMEDVMEEIYESGY